MYNITNVPSAASRNQIKAVVDGETVSIRCVEEPGTNGVGMTSIFIGDHMLDRPEDLRRMVGDAICLAIRLARDAGYSQAQADIRTAMGAKSDR